MKLFVRIFALSLVATGIAASAATHVSSNQTTASARVSALPIPMCPPDDPNACGLGTNGPSVR